jgi:hypothetical protein
LVTLKITYLVAVVQRPFQQDKDTWSGYFVFLPLCLIVNSLVEFQSNMATYQIQIGSGIGWKLGNARLESIKFIFSRKIAPRSNREIN